MPDLDRKRFAKCRAIMERGSTAGERAAGEAAARRIAAFAGLTLSEALRLTDGIATDKKPFEARGPAQARRPFPWEKAPLGSDPITVDEILLQKEANLARLKRLAAREKKRLREACARQEAEIAGLREAQAERDRRWAQKA